MENKEIYVGRGLPQMREELIEFLNLCFGFDGKEKDFIKLLPKLYKEQYCPCEHNYVVMEDQEIKSAIGVYSRELSVCGERISLHGVGNVAVHPDSRSKGYMKRLLSLAVDDMIKSGADMSDLGGLRQRYQYFSYEPVGTKLLFEITENNMRHCFGDSPLKPFIFEEITEDCPYLDDIVALHESAPFYSKRAKEDFVDIARSWEVKPWLIRENDRFVGYFIDDVAELRLVNREDFNDFIRNYVAERGRIMLQLPIYDIDLIEKAYKIYESVSVSADQSYTIFNFEKVIRAFLKLKTSYSSLPDGELVVCINGVAGKENIKICVRNNAISVLSTDQIPGIILEHKEAVSYFFGAISPQRAKNPYANSWFPLPLCLCSADHV